MALRWDLLVSLLAVVGLLGVLNHQAVRFEKHPSDESIVSTESLRGAFGVERSLQACSDRKSTSWCNKKRNKCSSSSAVYNNCQLTCGACTTEEPTPEPSSDGSSPAPLPPVATCIDARTSAWCQKKKDQGKCGRTSTYKHCLSTCDRCPTDSPSPTPPLDEGTPAPEPTPAADDATPAPQPAPSPTGAPPAPSSPLACSDTKASSWCLQRASKCRKRSIYKHCLKTCDRCPTEEPVPSPAPDVGIPAPTEPPAATPEPTKAPAATPEPTKPLATPIPTPITMTTTIVPETPAPTAPPAQTAEEAEVRALAESVSLMIINSPNVADALGGVVRLAFHDAGTFDGSTGGADGCVDLSSPENGGLASIVDMLEPIAATATILSKADVWHLAANVAVELAGGPAMEFRTGRKQASSCSGTASRLPDAEQGHDHIRDVFVVRLGFTEREVVALMGAHVLGRAQAGNSGYEGPWVPENQNSRFTNLYFSDLLRHRWNRRTLPDYLGMSRKEWRGPGNTIMLNTDIETAFDTSACGSAGGNGNCPRAQHGFSAAVTEFAQSQQVFFTMFSSAWTKLSALGSSSLACPLDDCSTPGPFAALPGGGGGGGGGGHRRRRGR